MNTGTNGMTHYVIQLLTIAASMDRKVGVLVLPHSWFNQLVKECGETEPLQYINFRGTKVLSGYRNTVVMEFIA